MQTLLTKKARNTLIKDKDTKGIILLHSLEAKKYPLDEYKMKEYYDNLNDRQREVAKDMLTRGCSFGLSDELLWQLKELFRLVRIVSCEDGTKQIIDAKEQKVICEYPF